MIGQSRRGAIKAHDLITAHDIIEGAFILNKYYRNKERI
jgi:hypothetical protein